MRLTRRQALRASVAGSLGLAGCVGGGGGGGESPTSTPTATPAPTTSPPTTAENPTVGVRSHPDLGDVLVGPDGLTLYMFDSDTKGAGGSACYDSCAENWPPLTVEGSPSKADAVTASVSTFERDGGSMQVAANGWPLYYFVSDRSPGDVTGQGVGDVWWVLGPDGTPVKPDSKTTTEESNETMTDATDGTATDDGYDY